MRIHAHALVVALLVCTGLSARADPLELRLAIEPGFATLRPIGEPSTHGPLAGLSASIGVARQLWLEAYADTALMPGHHPALSVTTAGGSLRYDIDWSTVAPYVALGLSRVRIDAERGELPTPETVLAFAAGFDVVSFGWLLWGAVMRYYPILGTDLFGSPGYVTVNGRVGIAYQGDR